MRAEVERAVTASQGGFARMIEQNAKVARTLARTLTLALALTRCTPTLRRWRRPSRSTMRTARASSTTESFAPPCRTLTLAQALTLALIYPQP